MIISHQHKFIFVCPRKVASTSIRISLSPSLGDNDVSCEIDAFRPDLDTDYFNAVPARNVDVFRDTADAALIRSNLYQHLLPGTIRRTVGAKIWDEYFKFTVIRNPWDLVVSFILYRLGPNWPGVPGWSLFQRRGAINALLRFRRCRARYTFQRGHYKDSVEQILKKDLFPPIAEIPAFYFLDGQKYADYYIRYEDLQNDYDEVCGLLQLPRTALPRTKSEVRKNGDDYRDYYTDWSREYIAELCREIIDDFGYRFDAGPVPTWPSSP